MPASGSARQTDLRSLFWKIHQSDGPTNDNLLDAVLGLERERIESGLSLGKLLVTHGSHRVDVGDTPYSVIRDLYRALAVPAATPIADLGAGYGRIGFYGAILWQQPVHGIEIVPERVNEARRVQQKLGLRSLRFEVGDLLTCVWPKVSHYLLLNSVLPSLIPAVIERFRAIALKRKIVIASVSTASEILREQLWLEEYVPAVPSAEPPASLRIFATR